MECEYDRTCDQVDLMKNVKPDATTVQNLDASYQVKNFASARKR